MIFLDIVIITKSSVNIQVSFLTLYQLLHFDILFFIENLLW